MVNIDNAFEFLETNVPEVFNPGIVNWRQENNRGDYVVDMRVAYKVNDHHRIALVVNNLLNREYAIRPLSIEEPRLTTIQYTFNW
jgi:outer membrane receptor for ferric coprogen and ferric-rhodotorulic acid